MSNTVYAVIDSSEELEFSEIDLVDFMIDGGVSYFRTLQELMSYNEVETDISDCKIFILTVTSKGTIKNNPKFVTLDELSNSKKSKK
jgi:hypothetical protein